jgi:type IV pilus assembly protein PilN
MSILKAIGFSARRKRMRRGSVHLVHDRWRASLQQRQKLKCEEYKINLLPWRHYQNKRFDWSLGIAAGLGAGIAFLFYLYSSSQVSNALAAYSLLDIQMKKISPKIKEMEKIKAANEALMISMKMVQTLQSTRELTAHLFDEMSRVMPGGVYLTHIQRIENQITLRGFAQTITQVSELMRNMEKNDWIKNPQLNEIKRGKTKPIDLNKDNAMNGSEFQLSFEIIS